MMPGNLCRCGHVSIQHGGNGCLEYGCHCEAYQ